MPYTPTPADLAALATALAADPSIHARLVASGEVGLAADKWDDATLTRWLVAEGGDVAKAAARLAKHATWRAALLPDGWTVEKERIIQDELVAGKTYVAASPDAAGRLLLLTASNRHLRAARDSAAMELALVYSMDVASKLADAHGDGKVVSIMDARGVRLCHLDNAVAKLVVAVAQDHYPERALHTHVYGSPRLFSALIAWVLPFIAPATRGKVTFVNGPADPKTWQGAACVTVDTLPAEVGGRGAAAVPVQDAARAVGLVKGPAVPPPPRVWAPYGVPAGRGVGKDEEEKQGVALTADASSTTAA